MDDDVGDVLVAVVNFTLEEDDSSKYVVEDGERGKMQVVDECG